MKKIIILGFLIIAPFAIAMENVGFNVAAHETLDGDQIPKTATIGNITLNKMGSGLREKSILMGFTSVYVYRATLLAAETKEAVFSRDVTEKKALDSLLAMKAFALQLFFKRDLDSNTVVNGFAEALNANGVEDYEQITQFKSELIKLGQIKTGETITLVANPKTGTLTAFYGDKRIEIKGDKKFVGDIFSIWLGTPADDYLGVLKIKLISGT